MAALRGAYVTLQDGENFTQGSLTDTAWDGVSSSASVIALLKRMAAGGGGSAVTLADGADVAEGTKADAAWDGVAASASAISILKKIATSGASAGLTDAQLRASAVPVSLTSTAITGTVDVSDRAGRLLGVVASITAAVDVSDRAGRLLGIVDKGKIWDGTNIATVKAGVVAVAGDNPLVVTLHPSSAPTAAQPVTGTFFQATQPVSAASLPLPAGAATEATLALLQIASGTAVGTLKHQVAGAQANASAPTWTEATFNPLSQTLAGALRIAGTVTATQGTPGSAANKWPVSVTDGTNTQAVKAASTLAVAADPAAVVAQSPMRADASVLNQTALSAANTTVTIILPAPAAGLFHYITAIEIVIANAGTAVAGTALLSFTTTNLGNLSFTCGNALAVGDTKLVTRMNSTTPLKSAVAATQSTIVAPACGLTAQVRMNVWYYTAP
jgi:hypothetical protein